METSAPLPHDIPWESVTVWWDGDHGQLQVASTASPFGQYGLLTAALRMLEAWMDEFAETEYEHPSEDG